MEYVLQNTISLVFGLEMVERSGLNTNAEAWETNVACVEAMLVGPIPKLRRSKDPTAKWAHFVLFIYQVFHKKCYCLPIQPRD